MQISDELYAQIWRKIPIPCVDLLIQDERGRVLLVRRKQEPAVNHWWFPGGRVHHGEMRAAAAARKLWEECGLRASVAMEIGTFDVVLSMPNNDAVRHGITTVFHMRVPAGASVTLDCHASEADWRVPLHWMREPLHDFVKHTIEAYSSSDVVSHTRNLYI